MLQRAREAYERYLGLLDNYRMLSKHDKQLYEQYLENRDDFALMSTSDLKSRRDTKIARLKQEKELELKLEVPLQYRILGGDLGSDNHEVSRPGT